MKIGLYNLEPKIINTALMQVSRYHKGIGDDVEFYDHLAPCKYDKIYAFSIFNFTDKSMVSSKMICGGTGFDIESELPHEIACCCYDWDIYNNCEFSIVRFSRGCIRKCEFCVVPKKEGDIRSVFPQNLNPRGSWINVQDNNFFANPGWRYAIDMLKDYGQPIDFNQGIDVRILTEEMADALNSLKLKNQIKIAWDNPKHDLMPKLREVVGWIKPYKLMCFVLVGYDSSEAEDLFRINSLIGIGIDPFVMPFDKSNRYQKDLARWINRKLFRACSWEDYDKNSLRRSK